MKGKDFQRYFWFAQRREKRNDGGKREKGRIKEGAKKEGREKRSEKREKGRKIERKS